MIIQDEPSEIHFDGEPFIEVKLGEVSIEL